MRHGYSTITPARGHTLARSILEATLGFQDYNPSVTLTQLLDLVLLINALARTLSTLAKRYFDFSHETARHALHANLTNLGELTQRFVNALPAVTAFSFCAPSL